MHFALFIEYLDLHYFLIFANAFLAHPLNQVARRGLLNYFFQAEVTDLNHLCLLVP